MNKLELPASGPSFELSFARDHVGRAIELLHVHESCHSILLGEAFEQAVLVLEDAALQIAGRTDVK
jgi:hypothetical protein